MRSAVDILELTELFSRTERRLSGELARLLEPDGCTVAAWRVLALVADGQGHAMTEVTQRALVPAPTATRLIDQMTSAGLVRRDADPEDRRRLLVHVTADGRALHRTLWRRIERERETIVARTDEAELARLVKLLDTLSLLPP